MSAAPSRINPFPGLRPFTQEEDYLFFGREEQTLELLQRLASNRFVAVVGTSGSGKSSLVRCGLLSELLGGRMLGAGASWEVAVMHPGGNPLALLTDALLAADLYDRQTEHARENLLATLSRSHFGLVEAVKQADLGEGTNFLLVVDQFEEIFRFHEAGQTQQEAANEFVSLLLEAAAQKDVPIYIVLTMRSDFIGDCGQFEGLAETVNRGEFLIPRLTREQYKRVIEGPIKVAGGQIAPRLLQRLLNDLGQQADQLPCLQHALMRTWNVRTGNGDADALDLEDYQRVGKMTQALSLHADEVYESLSGEHQRELCRGIFQALTVEEANNRGIRRPQRLGRLCQILKVPADELLPIIDAYRQSGVTFLMPSPEVELTDQTIIDISHESLMRVWTRLRHWVDEEAQAAGIYLRLSESAALHQQGKMGLYRDPELGIAVAWQESQRPNAAWAERYRAGFDTAVAFLKSSQDASVAEEQARESARQRELEQARQLAEVQQQRLEQQQRAARKLRKMIVGVAVVAVIAVLACIAALIANKRANTLAGIARQNEEKATQSQHETANALQVVASQKAAVEATVEEDRHLQYATDMQLAPFVWKDGNTTTEQLRNLLTKHIPDSKAADARPDLRGFEWYYYQHLLDSTADAFSVPGAPITDGAFISNGQLLTLSQRGQLRRWSLNPLVADDKGTRDLLGGLKVDGSAFLSDGRIVALAAGNKVHLFDTTSGKEMWSIDSAVVQVRLLAFSGDGSKLAIIDDKIRWCDAATGDVIATVDQKLFGPRYVGLSTDGLILAVGGYNLAAKEGENALNVVFHLDMATKKATGAEFPYGTISAGALSPDGKLLVLTHWFGGALTVFNTDAPGFGAVARNGTAHASRISSMAFSQDSTLLASADDKGTIKIWDFHSLNATPVCMFKSAGVRTMRFSALGKRLFTAGSGSQKVSIWNLESAGTGSYRVEGATNPGVARLSPGGLRIANADRVGVHLWDTATGKLVRDLPGEAGNRVHSVAFSPTDKRLFAVGAASPANPSFVALWDLDAGKELARLPGATDIAGFKMIERAEAVGALAFSPDGKYLVAGFGGRIGYPSKAAGSYFPVKVWDVATRTLVHSLEGHTFCVESVSFSRDGKLLASGGLDQKVIIWSTSTWTATQRLAGMGKIFSVVFSPDGKTLIVGYDKGEIRWWDVTTGHLLETVNGHATSVQALAFSPDGLTLASGSEDQTVRLWNSATRRQLMQLDPPADVELGTVHALDFSADGRQLLAAGGRASVVWSAAAIASDDIASLAKLVAEQPNNIELLAKLAQACQAAGRMREAVPYLARQLAVDPGDTMLDLDVAALQAWFGQKQEYAATRKHLLAWAKDTSDASTAERVAKACSLLPYSEKQDADAALILARAGAKAQEAPAWDSLALGMAEYRAGNYAAADKILLTPPEEAKDIAFVTDTTAFYRAMSLFQEGKPEEARQLATATAAKMKPLPADENNPLAADAMHDDLIEWLAWKEARALLKLQVDPSKK